MFYEDRQLQNKRFSDEKIPTQNLDDLTINIYNNVVDKYENKNFLFLSSSLFLWSHMLDLEIVLIVSSLVFNVPTIIFLLNVNYCCIFSHGYWMLQKFNFLYLMEFSQLLFLIWVYVLSHEVIISNNRVNNI